MKKGKETAKNSTKKRLFYSFFKKHKAIAVSLIILVTAVASFLVVNYGKYVKEIIQMYYLRTKNFYFNSDKLTINGKTYEINPWSGQVPQTIEVNMSSLLNSLKSTNSDILYEVDCIADANSYCYFENRSTTHLSRTISSTSHSDNFNITVELRDGIEPEDIKSVTVNVIARATAPYEEELKATFKLVIGNYGINYLIEDETGRLYFDSVVSNTLPTETVKVRLSIADNENIKIDMNNGILEDLPAASITKTRLIDGKEYITAITFEVPPKSSIMVRYYKKITGSNYTFNGMGINNAVEFECLEPASVCE